ncbi:MAG TPA: hypothetical protein PKA88_15930 [Polyangiaceae bacterium]|nr:hypothetical protein [Polyangiaceae bacterium]
MLLVSRFWSEMASSFQETNRALSRLLVEQARAIGVFDHPLAKGDGREELLRGFLADRVGSTFEAEVVDSNGGTTGELDVVVFDQSVASCLTVLGERRIVRAEAVAVTVEVKSRFEPSTRAEEASRVRDGIGSLTRFYRPGPLLAALTRHAAPDDPMVAMFQNGLSTQTARKINACGYGAGETMPSALFYR